jgi:hypothetical protein
MKLRHLAIALVLLFVTTAAAKAYVLFGPRWAIAQIPYYINPANGDGIPEATALADIQAAATAWTAQSNAAVSLYYMGRTSASTVVKNGQNDVFFRNASKDAAAATTYWWSDSSNRLIEADIIFWDATYTFVGGSSGCSGGVYVQDVMTHEFGHALGLAHTSVASATMYPSISKCSMSMRSLDPDDLSGIEALYPAAGANTAPTVTISAPAVGTSVTGGTSINFSGSASDKEDGNLSAAVSWRSSVDGQIGTGASFSRTLTAGSHTITASVTDSRGASSSRQTTVTVTAPVTEPAPSTPSTGVSLSANQYKVKGTHRVDLRWSGAATSSVNIFRDGVRVLSVPNTGSATDAPNGKGGRTYTYKLCEAGTATCSNPVVVVF